MQTPSYCLTQRKPRLIPNPMPTSPSSSTPEPDTSSVPMDNATIPKAALQAPTGTTACVYFLGLPLQRSIPLLHTCITNNFSVSVCVYLNKHGNVGPHMDARRVQSLPDHFGPGRASSVLQQCVQACVDCAHNQNTVFSCLKPGHGGELISGQLAQTRITIVK